MIKTLRNLAGASLALAMMLWGGDAFAQSATSPRCLASASAKTYAEGQFAPCSVDLSGNGRVTGSFSASLAGFTPNGNYATPLSVSTTTGNVALPTGAVVLVTNPGATVAYVNLGTSNAVTATTSHIPVPAGGGCAFTVGSNTYLAAITASSTTTLNLVGGAGLGNTCFGGGSSGGGGGAVTVANGADVTQGTIGDTQATGTVVGYLKSLWSIFNSNAPATSALQTTGNASLATIATNTGAPIPAGTNAIGGITNLPTTVSVGAGATGSSSPRNTVAQDTTTIAGAAPGTAGSASANVVTVQGVASMTKLLVTPDSVALPANQSVNQAQVNGTTILVNTGATGTGSPRVTVAVDSATVAGSATLPAGTNSIGTVQIGNTPNTVPIIVQPVPGTTNGLTAATITAANSTNATNLKASAGTLYHVTGYNNSATLAWVSFYNTAGTPTCGTSIVYQVMIPANSTSGAGAIDDIPSGLNFPTGIGYCITTGIAGTGSVAATSYVVDFGYK